MKTDDNQKFSARKRITSFGYAFNGIGYMFRTQHNSRIHLAIAILVVICGLISRVSNLEWCLLIFAMGLVFFAELINTAIEYLIDIVSPEFQEKAGHAKDLAAGAVLLTAITSVIIGLVIFIPRISEIVGKF